MAGTGKSTIARTVAHIYNEQKQLGASFFFSRDVGDLSDAGMFFTSIAVQLAKRSPILKHHICQPMETDRFSTAVHAGARCTSNAVGSCN